RQEDVPEFVLAPDALGCSPLSRYAKENPDRVMGLKEAFNSEAMRRTRLQMIAGERPAACRSCFQQEDLGIESHRTAMNRILADEVGLADLTKATDSDGRLDRFPVHSALRLGTTCTLGRALSAFPVRPRLGS